MLYLGAQPGPGSMHGGQWEATVEGPQNFADYSDQDKWGVLGGVAAESVPMRRTGTRSSAGSSKTRAGNSSSSSSARPRIHTSASAASYATSGTSATTSSVASPAVYGMASTGYPYYSSPGVMASTVAGMNPAQYLAMYGQNMGAAAYDSPCGVLSYGADLSAGLGHMHTQQQQAHVDPSCTQMHMDGFERFDGLDGLESLGGMDTMVYEPSPAAISPGGWGSSSSRLSSPDRCEDTWSLPPVAPSPAESHDSAASPYAAQLEAAAGRRRKDSGSSAANNSNHNATRSEGESARDHPLYKMARCQPDGFYHCPWEGKDNCNHKPEKLKCNYDKFVDSHLKPYRCKHSACENARFSSTACLLRHEREAHAMHGHGDKPYLCPHPECDRAHPGFGFPRQWNLKDHMRRVHHDDVKQDAVQGVQGVQATPLVPSSSQAVSKRRKRKKDAPSAATSSGSSRKSSTSSTKSEEARRQAEALAALEAAVHKKRTEFRQHKDALSSAVLGFTQADDPDMLAQLQAAQAHVDAMSRISSDMLAMQDPYGQTQTFPQQSG